MTIKVVNAIFQDEEDYISDLTSSFPEAEIVNASTTEEQLHHIRDADVFHGFLDAELYAAAERLKWYQIAAAGIDGIVRIPGFVESDVVLTNTKGPHVDSMANHAIGMMLILAHKWQEFFRDAAERRWDPWNYVWQYRDLRDSTMGILALGDVGAAIARRAHGFGMNVCAVDKHPKPAIPEVESIWGLERLDEMLSIASWFVIAAPLTPQSRGLIDRRRIDLLPEGAHVIIVSRGGIADQSALTQALRSGRLAGAGIDTFEDEPLAPDHPLWSMPNVVISPHVAGVARATRDGIKASFKENLRRYLAGEDFLYVCDKEAGF